MAVSPPQFADIQNSIIAYIQNNLVVTDQNGNSVIPNFSTGSVFLTLADVLALVMDAFYAQLTSVDAALRLATAAGADLDALGALVGAQRLPGSASKVAVKHTRNVITGTTITIPVGQRVLARDQFGNPTIEFFALQDPTQPTGVAGQVVAGSGSGWAWYQAGPAFIGAGGNIGAGQIAQLGAPLAGIDSVSNPQVAPVSNVSVTQAGVAGTTTRQYGIVAYGLTGTTTMTIGQTTTGNASPNASNYDIISWPATNDVGPGGYDVVLNTGTSGSPLWQRIANVPATQTTFSYQGQATTPYSVPATNTTGQGVGGVNPEPDDGNPGFRQRIPQTLGAIAKSTNPAILAAVQAVSGVTRVFGSDGATPGTFNVYYVGAQNPLDQNTQATIAAQCAAYKAAGISVTATQLTPTVVNVSYTFAAQAGQNANNLIGAVNNAISAYFATLTLGAAVRWSQVAAAITSVPGVAAATSITLAVQGGSSYTNADVPGQAGVLYTSGSYTVTVGS